MADIPHHVEDAVRYQFAVGPAGKIVIKSVECRRAVDTSFAVQASQVLFGFGVDRKNWVAGSPVCINQITDKIKLLLSVGGLPTGDVLLHLAKAQADRTIPILDSISMDGRSVFGRLTRNLCRRLAREGDVGIVWVTGRLQFERINKIGL
ncbi:MAG: hypothetical protein R3C05_07145 [Pirellulaceae bacterium]